MELKDAIERRKSVRKFSSKKPDWRNILEAINSAKYAPMAGGIFPLKFMLIDDKKLIEEIARWSEQEFINQVKYVVAVVSDSGMVSNPFPKKGKIFSHQESGAAIQNFLLSLEEFELSTCWIGHFNEEKIKKILKITEDYTIEAIFPIGYSDEKLINKKKQNHDMYNFLYFNEWENYRMKKVEKIEARSPEGY